MYNMKSREIFTWFSVNRLRLIRKCKNEIKPWNSSVLKNAISAQRLLHFIISMSFYYFIYKNSRSWTTSRCMIKFLWHYFGKFKGATKLQPKKIFVPATRKMKSQPTLWAAPLQNKFKLWNIKLKICIRKTKFTPHK